MRGWEGGWRRGLFLAGASIRAASANPAAAPTHLAEEQVAGRGLAHVAAAVAAGAEVASADEGDDVGREAAVLELADERPDARRVLGGDLVADQRPREHHRHLAHRRRCRRAALPAAQAAARAARGEGNTLPQVRVVLAVRAQQAVRVPHDVAERRHRLARRLRRSEQC